jgi:hypothetical protein
VTKGKAATIASNRVSCVLAKHKNLFKDGEMITEAFIEAVDSLFGDFKNKTEIMAANGIQLSSNTVTRRSEGIVENLEDQLKKDIDNCECFSL